MTMFIVYVLAYFAENQYNHIMRLHHNRFPSLLVFNITAFFKFDRTFFPLHAIKREN